MSCTCSVERVIGCKCCLVVVTISKKKIFVQLSQYSKYLTVDVLGCLEVGGVSETLDSGDLESDLQIKQILKQMITNCEEF